MIKEDVDITRALRKNYRLYLGQGIPDPWLTHSYSDYSEIPFIQVTDSENANIKKNIFQLLRGNFREKPCFCCEKKFLFECPDKSHSTTQNLKDKTNLLNCSCLDCHGKESTTFVGCCSQHCNCVPIIQNWVLEPPELRRCKSFRKKRTIFSDLSSSKSSKYNADEESSTESLSPPNNVCSCLRGRGDNVYFDCYNVEVPRRFKDVSQKRIFSAHPITRHYNKYVKNRRVKSLLCPCLKNFKCNQKELQNKTEEKNDLNSSPEPVKRSSKQSQTEFQPSRESKIIQTDKTKVSKSKSEKCPHNTKWIGSNVIHCDSTNAILNPQTGQSFTMCFAHPSLVCPYAHTSQLLIHPVDHKTKCKKEKRKNFEADKALQCNLPATSHEENNFTIRTKLKEPFEMKNHFIRPERDLCTCKSTLDSCDYSKYLMEKRVKRYFQQKESPREEKFDMYKKSYRIGEHLKRLEEERTTSEERKRNENETEVFKPVFHHKSYDFQSFPQEVKSTRSLKDEFHDLNSKFNSNVQTSTDSKIENVIKDKPVTIKFLKQIESNESRTYGLVDHSKSSPSLIKKRKKANRKGRRKPFRVKYSRPFSSKSKNLERSSKSTYETGTQSSEVLPFTKRVSFRVVENKQKATRTEKNLNFSPGKNLNLIIVGESFPSKKIFHTFTDTKARIEQETISRQSNNQGHLAETTKEPLKLEINFNDVLKQISTNNCTRWSSNALKNIVDELLLEKKL